METESPLVSGEGNTISSPDKKRQGLAKRWCFTFNNYLEEDVSNIKEFLENPSKNGRLFRIFYIVGKEVGESGTAHLQGYIECEDKIRPIGFFNWSKKIHWESARGTREPNVKYCSKDGDYFTNIKIDKPLKVIKEESFYTWQRNLIDLISGEPDDRSIHWYWEEDGNVGKSAICKYICVNFDALIVSGKGSDIKYMIKGFKESKGFFPTVILYDIPRSSANFVSWSAIEEIKNGLFASSKYECEMVVMNSPFVLCFANFLPDLSLVSADRWVVTNL